MLYRSAERLDLVLQFLHLIPPGAFNGWPCASAASHCKL